MLEEFFFIPANTFHEVILPIIVLGNVALLAISTLGHNPSAYQYELLESDFFDKEYITYACKPCIAAGKAGDCKHNLDMVPHWSNEERLELVKLGMGKSNQGDFQIESLGVVESDDRFVFNHAKIKEIFAKPYTELEDYVSHIYVSIDPAAGSDIAEKTTSHFAIVSICEPYTTVIGMEKVDIAGDDDYDQIIRNHMTRLRNSQYTQNSVIVLDVEGNNQLEVNHIIAVVTSVINKNLEIVSDFKRKRGTKTTQSSKEDMYKLTKQEIKNLSIRFSNDLVTSYPKKEEMLNDCKNQFLAYARYATRAQHPNQVTKYTYSGKGENNRDPDDLCVTMQRAILLRQRFNNTLEFASRR